MPAPIVDFMVTVVSNSFNRYPNVVVDKVV